MGAFRHPSDAVALVHALQEGLALHVHDDFTDTSTFDLSSFAALLGDRDAAIENVLGRLPLDIPFSQVPGVVQAVRSGPYTPKTGFTVVGASASLGTAGTSTTTVVVEKNGTSIGTVNLASGVTYASIVIAPGVIFHPRLDVLTVNCTAVGTGAQTLTSQVEGF